MRRDELVKRALERLDLDLLVCALPINVVLISGYWPVVGTSVALAMRDGRVLLVVPKDEDELAEKSWADDVDTFEAASLDRIEPLTNIIEACLRESLGSSASRFRRIGYESGLVSEPVSYAAMNLYGGTMLEMLRDVFPTAQFTVADDELAALCAIKTQAETEHIRYACQLAANAFEQGVALLKAGLTETAVAAMFRIPLSGCTSNSERPGRCDGFMFCMSGVNSAKAFGAYARSRSKIVEAGDLVLMHCNSYADGYWTDITRTYCMGTPDDRQRKMYTAISAAREAALAAIRPGARAADVDKAARDVIAAHGFGKEFKHATGHGVGFAAIDHNAMPRIHPKSNEVLEPGMVFNVEPGIYIDDFGGMRHCDMVAVTETGVELLTPFQAGIEELTR